MPAQVQGLQSPMGIRAARYAHANMRAHALALVVPFDTARCRLSTSGSTGCSWLAGRATSQSDGAAMRVR
jgi:hypothetical protein